MPRACRTSLQARSPFRSWALSRTSAQTRGSRRTWQARGNQVRLSKRGKPTGPPLLRDAFRRHERTHNRRAAARGPYKCEPRTRPEYPLGRDVPAIGPRRLRPCPTEQSYRILDLHRCGGQHWRAARRMARVEVPQAHARRHAQSCQARRASGGCGPGEGMDGCHYPRQCGNPHRDGEEPIPVFVSRPADLRFDA
jgi:hypothetical protein